MRDWQLSDNAAYLHYCPNETIDGIAIHETPDFGSDVVVTADLSSTILSTPLDVSRFGVIYAGAQKNIGPAGLTLVIVREDLLGKAHVACPSILDYTVLNDNDSMFNTPPTFAWYLSGLVFKWLKKNGGVTAMDRINQQKASLLYSVIDNSDFYRNDVAVANRSRMNVPFQLADTPRRFSAFSHIKGPDFLIGNPHQETIMRPTQFRTQCVSNWKATIKLTHFAQIRFIQALSKFSSQSFR